MITNNIYSSDVRSEFSNKANYVNHEESKSDGDIGTLCRKHLKVESIVHIGKESNNLEDTQMLGVKDGDYQIYSDEMSASAKESKFKNSVLDLDEKTASKFGVSIQTLRNIERKIKKGKSGWISRKNQTKFQRAYRAITRI